jgi:hypothetical protein
LTVIEIFGKGFPESSVTTPEIDFICAAEKMGKRKNKNRRVIANNKEFIRK